MNRALGLFYVLVFGGINDILVCVNKNLSTLAVQMAPGVAAAEPLIRKLFLLHPAYPTILLELCSTTDTTVTSAGKSSNLYRLLSKSLKTKLS